jgi:vancomycin resistance protein YoaR
MMNENQTQNQTRTVLSRLMMALPIALVVFILVGVIALLGFEAVYADRVYPRVYVQNIDLTGMTLEETNAILAEALQYTTEGRIRFIYQDSAWEVRPLDLGYWIDASSSAEQAISVGRERVFPISLVEKARAWFTGVQLTPVARYDERVALAFLQSIAEEIDQPLIEASLGLENTDVIVVSGQVGREVNITATLAAIGPYLLQMEDADIPLVVEESSPVIMDVGPQAALARKILSEPLVLTAPAVEGEDAGSWSIAPEDLAAMLIIHRVEGENGENDTYQIGINESLMQVYLSSLAPGLYVYPVNARFIFNDETSLLEVEDPAVIGRDLDIEGSIEHINRALLDGAHEIPLTFQTLMPTVTDDASGEELGIIELVHQETSYFFGSDPARVQNIRASASRFHGLLIAPWETFSMAQALGNISLDNGYAEAPIIFGGQTIQGIGGGVCQVSTTLFRAAFFAGFPINERHAHSYRVGYYEQRSNGVRDPRLAGLDATVYVPIVDMKFTNDTDHWLLMETYMGNYSLTWKFYSTSDGRTVNWETTGPTNIVKAPEDLYRENPDLSKGTIKQVDYSADGADVNVTRTVYINDQVYFSDAFFTRFQPWQAIYEYGPGTEGIPEPDIE